MILSSTSEWESVTAVSKRRVVIYICWHLCKKKLMSVTQWQRSIFKKSFMFNKGLFILLSFKSCSCVRGSTMNWFILISTAQYSCVCAYFVDFFQHQQADSLTLVLDVHLIKLMPVCGDKADFSNRVLIAYSVKEVVDPLCRDLLECVVWVDVHHLAVFSKVHQSVQLIEQKKKHSTYSLHRSFILLICDSVNFS